MGRMGPSVYIYTRVKGGFLAETLAGFRHEMVPSIAPLLALPLLFPDIRGWHIAFPNNSASLSNDLREGDQRGRLAFIFPGGSYQSDVIRVTISRRSRSGNPFVELARRKFRHFV